MYLALEISKITTLVSSFTTELSILASEKAKSNLLSESENFNFSIFRWKSEALLRPCPWCYKYYAQHGIINEKFSLMFYIDSSTNASAHYFLFRNACMHSWYILGRRAKWRNDARRNEGTDECEEKLIILTVRAGSSM